MNSKPVSQSKPQRGDTQQSTHEQADDSWPAATKTAATDTNMPRRESAPDLSKRQGGQLRRVSSLEMSRPRTPIPGVSVDEDEDEGLECLTGSARPYISQLLAEQAASEPLSAPFIHPGVTKDLPGAVEPPATDADKGRWSIELPKTDPTTGPKLASPSVTHGSSSGEKSYLGPPAPSQAASQGILSRTSEPAHVDYAGPPLHVALHHVSTKLSEIAADRDEGEAKELSDSDSSSTSETSSSSEGCVSDEEDGEDQGEEDEDDDGGSRSSSILDATPSQSDENGSYAEEDFAEDEYYFDNADEEISESEGPSQDDDCEDIDELDEGQISPQPERAATFTEFETGITKLPEVRRTVSWSGWIQEIEDADDPDTLEEPSPPESVDLPEDDENSSREVSPDRSEDGEESKDSKDESQDVNEIGDTEPQDAKPMEADAIETKSVGNEKVPAKEVDPSQVYPYNFVIFRPKIGELPNIWGLRDPRHPLPGTPFAGPGGVLDAPMYVGQPAPAAHFRDHRDSIELYEDRIRWLTRGKEKQAAGGKTTTHLNPPKERLQSDVYKTGIEDIPEGGQKKDGPSE
jgi:hypothetical protein